MREAPQDRLFDREVEFIYWLVGLMGRNAAFSDVTLEPFIGTVEWRARADIMAVRKIEGVRQTLIIECKNRPLYGRALMDAIVQLVRYREVSDGNLILAIPARLSLPDQMAVRSAGIELWDLDAIARIFAAQLADQPPHIMMALGAITTLDSVEDNLVRELTECVPGKSHWSVYQKLIGRVIEHCFCPPLNAPISESPDQSGTNRRDFILANFAESGFWSHMRSRYLADYVVVDAKNYAGKVKKRDILQIANYLKPFGTGLFGMIISRNGPDASAIMTAREQWAHSQKLILVLDDRRCEALIRAAAAQESVQVLVREIQEFRLSM